MLKKLFFIHTYQDGKMVKFTKTPQVLHKNTTSLSGVKVGSLIRTIRGRIAKVKRIYKREVDTSKYADLPQTELQHIFSVKFLDNGNEQELQPSVTMTLVKARFIDLFCYTIYMKITPKK